VRHLVDARGTLVELPDRVRGTRNPDLAAIRALEPDLVVANAEAGFRELLEGAA
jgi:hypothetical protein